MRFTNKLLRAQRIATSASPTAEDIHWIDLLLQKTDGAQEKVEPDSLAKFFWLNAISEVWLTKLAHHVTKCPRIVLVENGYRIPTWHPAIYLRRQIEQGSKNAVEVLLKVKTDNPKFFELVTFAINSESPENAMRLLPVLRESFKIGYGRIGGTIAQAAEAYLRKGLFEQALELCVELLKFNPDPETEKKRERKKLNPEDWTSQLNPQQTKLDRWDYLELLENTISRLSQKVPLPTAIALLQVTAEMLRLRSYELDEASDSWPDYSEIWCRRVNKPSRDHFDEKEALVYATTSACDNVFKSFQNNAEKIELLDRILKEARWEVFKRIRLHIYSHNPALSRDWMVEEILGYKHYHDRKYGFEFYQMIQSGCKAFGVTFIGELDRSIIFDQILSGPKEADFKAFAGSLCSAQSFAEYQSHFQLLQLHPFESVLFGKYRQIYENLVQEEGRPPQDGDYPRVRSSEAKVLTSESPISTTALEQMSDSELINYLNNWESSENVKKDWWVEIDFRGLGVAFQKLVTNDIARFLDWGEKWLTLQRPIYLRLILEMAAQRVKERKFDELEMWFSLGDFVMSQPALAMEDYDEKAECRRINPDWSSAKRAAVDFLGSCLEDEVKLPSVWRARIIKLLKLACVSPDRMTPWTSQDGTGRDYLTEAINSTRGRAMEFLISYGVWLKRTEGELVDVSDVFEVLKNRVEGRPRLTAPEHALLGQQLPRLNWLNPDWISNFKSQLFPLSDVENWVAAFSSYVIFNHAKRNLFDLLLSDFRFAVNKTSTFASYVEQKRDFVGGMGQHLFAFYAWGKIELQDSLFEDFYKNTDPEQWATLFDGIGRSLSNSGPDVSPTIVSRCQQFFEFRLDARNGIELHEFLFWLEAACLPSEWRLNALFRSLEFTKSMPGQSSMLVETLVGFLDEHPSLVVRCFERICERAAGGEYFHLQADEAKRILIAGFGSNDSDVVKAAKAAQDNLLKGGFFEFLDISSPNISREDALDFNDE